MLPEGGRVPGLALAAGAVPVAPLATGLSLLYRCGLRRMGPLCQSKAPAAEPEGPWYWSSGPGVCALPAVAPSVWAGRHLGPGRHGFHLNLLALGWSWSLCSEEVLDNFL